MITEYIPPEGGPVISQKVAITYRQAKVVKIPEGGEGRISIYNF